MLRDHARRHLPALHRVRGAEPRLVRARRRRCAPPASRRCARASSAATCCWRASSPSPRAVLFATDSFWEGVDVRGDALRCVVITRLPFRVPTEPLEQARVEAIAARGGDPFAERALPQAVIKLQAGLRPPDPQPHRPRLRRRARQPHRRASATGACSSHSLPPARTARSARRRAGAAQHGGVLHRKSRVVAPSELGSAPLRRRRRRLRSVNASAATGAYSSYCGRSAAMLNQGAFDWRRRVPAGAPDRRPSRPWAADAERHLRRARGMGDRAWAEEMREAFHIGEPSAR